MRTIVAVAGIVVLCCTATARAQGEGGGERPPALERLKSRIPEWDALMGSKDASDRAKLYSEYFEGKRDPAAGRDDMRHPGAVPAKIQPDDEECVALILAMTVAGTPDDLKEKLMWVVERRNLAARVPDFIEVCLDTTTPVAWTALRLYAGIVPKEKLLPVLKGALKANDGMKYTALAIVAQHGLTELKDEVAKVVEDPVRGPEAAALLGGMGDEGAEPLVRAAVEKQGKYQWGFMSYYAAIGRGKVPAVLLDHFRDHFTADWGNSGYLQLAQTGDPAALEIFRSLRDRWAEKGRFADGRPLPKEALQAALIAAGDEASIPGFMDALRERLKAGRWYMSDFEAMHALNQFSCPEIYGMRQAAAYPLRSGNVVAHAKALSEWTGIRFEVSEGVAREAKLDVPPGGRRLQLVMRFACFGGVCVLGKDGARVMTREEAAAHWIKHFAR